MIDIQRAHTSGRRWWRATGALAVVAMAATGCGGGSGAATSSDSSTVSATASDSGTSGATADTASAFTPERPECIAPADPGGGWDFTCRQAAALMQELGLFEGQMQVTNMPGGGGGVAFAHVVAQRSEDDDLVVAASPSTTLRLAQGQYESLSADKARWLGAIAADFGVIVVGKDSTHTDFESLASAWKADPGSIAIGGGSAVGGQDHMKVLLLAEAVGIPVDQVKYVPFDGGGEAMTALQGGFIDVFAGDISESLGQLEAGNIGVLAALSPERLDAVPDVPTAKELGYDTEWVVWRGFYAPAGMSDEAYAYWIEALETLEASEQWAEKREASGLGEFVVTGEEFTTFVEDQIASFKELSASVGLGT